MMSTISDFLGSLGSNGSVGDVIDNVASKLESAFGSFGGSGGFGRKKRQDVITNDYVTVPASTSFVTPPTSSPTIIDHSNTTVHKVHQRTRQHARNMFPYGQWDWGLLDLGLLSGKPDCGSSRDKKCYSKGSILDKW